MAYIKESVTSEYLSIFRAEGKGNLMANITIILILLAVIGSAVRYIWKEKKKGTKCIGCPNSGCCPRRACGGNESAISKYKSDH